MTWLQFFFIQTTLWFFVGCISKSFHSAKKRVSLFASRPNSTTFWTSKQENMFYCLVFFLKHLYNTYTIVQNVDRYYIGVPYLEGIMDSACKQGSLWGLQSTPPHDKWKNSPKQTTPSSRICSWHDDDFGYFGYYYPKPDLLHRSARDIFLSPNRQRFFGGWVIKKRPKRSIYSKDRPIKTSSQYVCTRQITIHFPSQAWQKHNLQNNRSELLMVI